MIELGLILVFAAFPWWLIRTACWWIDRWRLRRWLRREAAKLTWPLIPAQPITLEEALVQFSGEED